MENRTLGDAIRQGRTAAGISLRELAKQVSISAPFLSDVELGRRYPSDDVLADIARLLKIELEDFKKYDHRESFTEFKRLLEGNPALGVAFRSAMTHVKKGNLSTEELAKRLAKTP